MVKVETATFPWLRSGGNTLEGSNGCKGGGKGVGKVVITSTSLPLPPTLY